MIFYIYLLNILTLTCLYPSTVGQFIVHNLSLLWLHRVLPFDSALPREKLLSKSESLCSSDPASSPRFLLHEQSKKIIISRLCSCTTLNKEVLPQTCFPSMPQIKKGGFPIALLCTSSRGVLTVLTWSYWSPNITPNEPLIWANYLCFCIKYLSYQHFCDEQDDACIFLHLIGLSFSLQRTNIWDKLQLTIYCVSEGHR